MWTLDHVSRYNIGYVGGVLHLASIEKVNNRWTAQYVETGETSGQVEALENYIFEFGNPSESSAVSTCDKERIIDEVLSREGG
jgi:hypothetical protein